MPWAARARAWRPSARDRVTGSAGKTSVKEALFAALDRGSRGRAHRSVKSYNNHVGVPLSLARMPARTQFGVFEMGMNHAGELSALTRLVRPHVAIVTTIAPAHIGHFSGEEGIADAKGEIFEGLEPGGVAIIPADSRHYERLRAKAAQHAGTIIAFGRAAHADVRLLDVVPAPGGGSLVTADLGDRKLCYTVAQPGDHWVINSLAVMAAVRPPVAIWARPGWRWPKWKGWPGAARAIRCPRRAAMAAARAADRRKLQRQSRLDGGDAGRTGQDARRAHRRAGRDARAGRGRGPLSRRTGRTAARRRDCPCRAGRPRNGGIGRRLGEKRRRRACRRALQVDHVQTSAEAADVLARIGIAGGDAILVKGSNSVGLGALVKALA
jgi:UDP-N-acetylmuramoyl-tripeptide--D-alanyl-D-alanine ligase